jgi:hypothetical protein
VYDKLSFGEIAFMVSWIFGETKKVTGNRYILIGIKFLAK